ncbi:MAG: cyclic nucleotide-binding domain-containing protein [Byssovorax sp.]
MAREPARPAAPLITIERELFLRSISVALPQGGGALQLARAMRDASFRAGEIIYRAGDFTRLIHFITHGEVELTGVDVEPWKLAAPAVIGILDVNQRRPFSRTARALTDVRALVLREDDWFEVFEEHFEFARASLRRVAGDVHELHLAASPGGGFPQPPTPTDFDAHALNLQERTLALRAVPAFRTAGIQSLALLAAGATELALGPGERLFARDEPSLSLFAVARGTIRIERENPVIRARFGPGSLVGGCASVSFVTQPYHAEAEVPSVVLELRREALIDTLEDHVEMIHAMFSGLSVEREEILDDRARRARLARG